MLGTMIGDIAGSVYEFNNIKTKEFEFFSKYGRFTYIQHQLNVFVDIQ